MFTYCTQYASWGSTQPRSLGRTGCTTHGLTHSDEARCFRFVACSYAPSNNTIFSTRYLLDTLPTETGCRLNLPGSLCLIGVRAYE